jgi:hypothetical protein
MLAHGKVTTSVSAPFSGRQKAHGAKHDGLDETITSRYSAICLCNYMLSCNPRHPDISLKVQCKFLGI